MKPKFQKALIWHHLRTFCIKKVFFLSQFVAYVVLILILPSCQSDKNPSTEKEPPYSKRWKELKASSSQLKSGKVKPQSTTSSIKPSQEMIQATPSSSTNQTSIPCSKPHLCQTKGLCTEHQIEQKSYCIATSEDSCLQSRFCKQKGACQLKDQKCVPSQQGCEKSQVCRDFGLCSLYNQRCQVRSERECQASTICKENQACYYTSQGCKTLEDLHAPCREGCLKNRQGQCRCSTEPKTRRRKTYPLNKPHNKCTLECRNEGRCSLQGQHCKATEKLMCQLSEECLLYGKCTLEQGICIRSASGCKTSLLCKLFGRCAYSKGACIANQDEQCQRSQECREHQVCQLDRHTESCRQSPPQVSCIQPCALQGKCTIQTLADAQGQETGQRCITRSNQECAQAEICKKYGQCTAVNGRCIANRHQDCKSSIQCELFGYCRASLGRCIR